MTVLSIRGRMTKRFAEHACDANTVTDVARLCGVSRPTVYAWLRGVGAHGPSLKRLASICGESIPNGEDLDVLTGRRIVNE